MGIIDEDALFVDEGKTTYVLRPSEGAMLVSDRLNNAYIRSIFEDTFVVSGHQFMPFQASIDKEVQKLLNFIGVIVYPVCLALCTPVFLHHLVMEKETKLVENMKINGMKMYNYWLVNGVFNFCSYCITAILFWSFGRYVCDLDFFTDTNGRVLFEIYFIWGLC